MRQGADAQGVGGFLVGQRAFFKVVLGVVVVGLGGELDHVLARGGDFGFQFRRHRSLVHGAIVSEEERLARHQVDDAAKLVPRADGVLYRDRVGAEDVLQVVEGFLERGVLAVHARDEGDRRQSEFLRGRPHLLGFDAQFAGVGGGDEDGAGAGAQAVQAVREEVRVSRRVEQGDVVLVPGKAVERGAQRRTVLVLLRLEVEVRVVLIDPALAVHRARGEEESVGDRGLADPALSDDADTADQLHVFGHDFLLFRYGRSPGRPANSHHGDTEARRSLRDRGLRDGIIRIRDGVNVRSIASILSVSPCLRGVKASDDSYSVLRS